MISYVIGLAAWITDLANAPAQVWWPAVSGLPTHNSMLVAYICVAWVLLFDNADSV